MATCGKINTPFLEVCSVGLVSTLFSSVDDIQHGNLARVGDSQPAIRMLRAEADYIVPGHGNYFPTLRGRK